MATLNTFSTNPKSLLVRDKLRTLTILVANSQWLFKCLVISWLLLGAGFMGVVSSQSHVSPNYHVDESFMGDGGINESSSANYLGQDSIGASAVGETGSNSFQTHAGYTTTSDPSLVFIVNTSTVSLGVLSTADTATGNSTFSVLNYTSHGYVVMTIGSPPTSGNHTIAGMASTAASQVGIEQYGINLKANTSPETFGADPVQTPSGAFSFGEAAPNYDTTNNYRYVAGESIARSVKSSGRTDFTISYIVNVATTTAGGQYTTNQDLICVGTY